MKETKVRIRIKFLTETIDRNYVNQTTEWENENNCEA